MSRLDDWIAANKPAPPSVPIHESVDEYNRQWNQYEVQAREYRIKLREIVARHEREIRAAIPDGLLFVDGEPSYRRTYDVYETKKGDG